MILLKRKISKQFLFCVFLLFLLLILLIRFDLLYFSHLSLSQFIRVVAQTCLYFIFFLDYDIHLFRLWIWKRLKSLLFFVDGELIARNRLTFTIKTVGIESTEFRLSYHVISCTCVKSFHSLSKTSSRSFTLERCIVENEILTIFYRCFLGEAIISCSSKVNRFLEWMTRFLISWYYLLVAIPDLIFWKMSLHSHSIKILDLHYPHWVSYLAFTGFQTSQLKI